jgi:predicted dehydrogenase
VLEGFRKRFPELRPTERERLFDDAAIDVVVSAAIPRDRPAIAIPAMRAGKDVMVDKPGAGAFDQLAEIARAARQTGRIFSHPTDPRHGDGRLFLLGTKGTIEPGHTSTSPGAKARIIFS